MSFHLNAFLFLTGEKTNKHKIPASFSCLESVNAVLSVLLSVLAQKVPGSRVPVLLLLLKLLKWSERPVAFLETSGIIEMLCPYGKLWVQDWKWLLAGLRVLTVRHHPRSQAQISLPKTQQNTQPAPEVAMGTSYLLQST